ncbi:Uncharacterised protein [Mycobacteroides abscessus]|nr:Uncharacterised protein [Mycobacteroides abscessus]
MRSRRLSDVRARRRKKYPAATATSTRASARTTSEGEFATQSSSTKKGRGGRTRPGRPASCSANAARPAPTVARTGGTAPDRVAAKAAIMSGTSSNGVCMIQGIASGYSVTVPQNSGPGATRRSASASTIPSPATRYESGKRGYQ